VHEHIEAIVGVLGTRFVAAESNVTECPDGLLSGRNLPESACADPVATLTRRVPPIDRSRSKMSPGKLIAAIKAVTLALTANPFGLAAVAAVAHDADRPALGRDRHRRIEGVGGDSGCDCCPRWLADRCFRYLV
jgi:hypothetical protein